MVYMQQVTTTRRDFVRNAAAAALACGAPALASAKFANAEEPQLDGTQPNRVCEILGIEKPVIQAMMLQLTSPEFAAAVSNAGGLGVIGAQTAEDIEAVRALTDKPFAAYVWEYSTDELLDMLVAENVKIVVMMGMKTKAEGNHAEVDMIRRYKDTGITVVYRALHTTPGELVEAQEAGADIVIASGWGAGGCNTETMITLRSMLKACRPQITIPLMGAGCIVDADSATAIAALGAEGAYVGTRFLASAESPAADSTKQAIVDTSATDLVSWRMGVIWLHGTRTECTEKCIEMPYSGQADSTVDLTGTVWSDMRDGTTEDTFVNMNDAVDSITTIKTCQEIVDEIGSAWV